VPSRLRVLSAVIALAASIAVPGPVAAEGGVPTTTTITRTYPTPVPAYTRMLLYMRVDVQPGIGGTWGSADIVDITGGGEDLIGTVGIGNTGVETWLILENGLPAGDYTLEARFTPGSVVYEPSTSAPFLLTVEKAPVTLGYNQPDPIETHHGFSQFITALGATTWAGTDGDLKLWRVGSATPICTRTGYPLTVTCPVPALPAGTHEFYTTYSGNAQVQSGESTHWFLTVVPDVVHATGVGTQYTTFYPVTDTYRDTVGIKGTRAEIAAVTIKIYSPGGTLLKTVSLANGTGAYNYNWNGRNSAGTIYAEGNYKIVQTLKDTAGVTMTVTSYVTLSKKKLYTYTKTITKLGSSVTAKGAASGGTVTLNTTSGYAKLYAPTIYSSWAGAGWELTLPGATIYKSFYVRVYGRHSGAMGETRVGAQNFSTCAYAAAATWYDSCFASWKAIPSTSGTTLYYYKTANLSSSYRSGTKVRLLVTSTYGTTYIYKAQVVVTYQVLKY